MIDLSAECVEAGLEAGRAAVAYDKRPISRGVHGWAGRWLVNGAGDDIVSIALDPPQRGYVMGFPVRLKTLLVSVDDPGAVMTARAK